MIMSSLGGHGQEIMVCRLIEAERRRGRIINLDYAAMKSGLMPVTFNLIKLADTKSSWSNMTTISSLGKTYM